MPQEEYPPLDKSKQEPKVVEVEWDYMVKLGAWLTETKCDPASNLKIKGQVPKSEQRNEGSF